MTYEEFKSVISPKPGTTEGTIKSWYKWCTIGTWSSNIITHKMDYSQSDFHIKNISLDEHNEFLKIYNYFDKLAKSKLLFENLQQDFK